MVYECGSEEEEIRRLKEDADARARGLAAMQRLCSVDFDYGTWL